MSLLSFLAAYLAASSIIANPECLYDSTRDFSYNCTKEYPAADFQREPVKEFNKSLFGYPVASLIGIPACAIMTGNGIEWAAQSGYDILTYKTVRSRPFVGHPLPNILLLENSNASAWGVADKMITLSEGEAVKADSITMANSMGIPSLSLEWTLKDIAKARAALQPGQILIVSIIGNPSEERTLEEDFAFLARVVSKAGAHIVEANLSCPNLHSPLATYKDPLAVSAITEAIYKEIPNIPIILKVGLFDSFEQMKEVFKAAHKSKAKGICGINSMALQVVDSKGNPAFGETRKIAGVSGDYIRPHAYEFVKKARRIIQEEHLDLLLFATGGIMKPEHFDLFLEAGADFVMSATGAMWNPNLAKEFHQGKK